MTCDTKIALIGGLCTIGGAIISVLGMWAIQKRNENKANNKYTKPRKDFIAFLNKFLEFKKQNKIEMSILKYFENLGLPRFERIIPAINQTRIIMINRDPADNWAIHINNSVFYKITQNEINDIIRNIKNGVYDNVFN